jgi:hypothetical protein
MQHMSREELLSLLDDIRAKVAAGDSFEGKLHYLLGTDADRPFEVAAVYRTGNLLGHGTTEMVGVNVGPLQCTNCPDTVGPFTEGGLCEDCAERPLVRSL